MAMTPTPANDGLVWVDPKTPKICATCIWAAEVSDGHICLRTTSVKKPLLVMVNLYANSAKCPFWQKGAELQTEADRQRLLGH
jgi:hypothetical protein